MPADVLLAVQDGLEQVRDAPAMGDVVPEQLAQLLGGLAGVGVAPGPERRQQFAVGVEGEIAVHHRRYPQRADRVSSTS